MVCPSCTHRETSASFAASAVKTQAKDSAGAADKSPKPATVAEFFAAPPFWLSQQLEVYHQDPERHFEPLCTAVAAVILKDGLRWEEVARDVERELSRRMQG